MIYETTILGQKAEIEYYPVDGYADWESALIFINGADVTESIIDLLSQRELNQIEDALNADYQMNQMVSDDGVDPYWNDHYHYMGGV